MQIFLHMVLDLIVTIIFRGLGMGSLIVNFIKTPISLFWVLSNGKVDTRRSSETHVLVLLLGQAVPKEQCLGYS